MGEGCATLAREFLKCENVPCDLQKANHYAEQAIIWSRTSESLEDAKLLLEAVEAEKKHRAAVGRTHHSVLEVALNIGPTSWTEARSPAVGVEVFRSPREGIAYLSGFHLAFEVGTSSETLDTKRYLSAGLPLLSFAETTAGWWWRLAVMAEIVMTPTGVFGASGGYLHLALGDEETVSGSVELRPGAASRSREGQWDGTWFCTPREACWVGRMTFDFWLTDWFGLDLQVVFPVETPLLFAGLKFRYSGDREW